MLEDQAHALTSDLVRRQARDLIAIEHDGAGAWSLDAHDELHHGRLAGAVRPDKAQNFAALQLEIDIVDSNEAAKPLR